MSSDFVTRPFYDAVVRKLTLLAF